LAALVASVAIVAVAQFFSELATRRGLEPELSGLHHIDVVIPIQEFSGSKFTIREANLRFELEAPLAMLADKLVPALNIDAISVESDHLAAVAPPMSLAEMLASLHRNGISVDGLPDEAAFVDGAVLTAHL